MADQLCMERMRCGQTFLQRSHGAFQNAPDRSKALNSPCVFQCKMKLNILVLAFSVQLTGGVAASIYGRKSEGREPMTNSKVFLIGSNVSLPETSAWYFSSWKTSRQEDHSVALGSVCVYSRVCPHSFHILHIFTSKFTWLCTIGLMFATDGKDDHERTELWSRCFHLERRVSPWPGEEEHQVPDAGV